MFEKLLVVSPPAAVGVLMLDEPADAAGD